MAQVNWAYVFKTCVLMIKRQQQAELEPLLLLLLLLLLGVRTQG